MIDDGYVPPWVHDGPPDPECERAVEEHGFVACERFSYGKLMACRRSDGRVIVLKRPFQELPA